MKNRLALYLLIFIIISFFYSGCSNLPYKNNAPVVVSAPVTSINVEELYVYDVNADDLEGDSLLYSLIEYPSGMTIDDQNGIIKWKPTKEQAGDHSVVISVEDRWRNDTQKFILETNDVLLSAILVEPDSIILMETYSNLLTQNFLKVTALYNDGSSQLIELSQCDFKSSNKNIAFAGHTGIISGTSKGSAIITVSYTENNITQSDNVEVVVTPFIVGDD